MKVSTKCTSLCGDASAFPESYRAAVERYLRGRIAARPDLEDLVQEVCLRFLASQSAPRDPLGYLLGVAKHSLADYYDRKARERIVVGEQALSSGSIADAAVCARDHASDVETSDWLGSVLRILPKSHRRVLLAHEYDGYTYVEVAMNLGFTVQTVEKYLHQAKAMIRATHKSVSVSSN